MRLYSVYEPNVDATAAGKLAANIHGTFNQYFSDALSEKMQDRMHAAVLAGRFPWPAPIGYLNDSKLRTGTNLVPDPQRAPLVWKAFELIATGDYKKTDVLRIITDDGLRTKKGRNLSGQTFEQMLMKSVYCGYISTSRLPQPVKGEHEPLVSEELFQTVLAVLSGRKLTVAPKRKFNPNFPLKWFVRCASRGTPLTGGLVTGKNRNRKYGYYWCRRQACSEVMVRRERLEDLFMDHLRRLQPDKETIQEFPAIAEQVWRQTQGDAEENAKTLHTQLEDQKRMKSELLPAKLRGEVNQATTRRPTQTSIVR